MKEHILQRKISQWTNCVPEEMAKMSQSAIQYALAYAKADILTLSRLLCEAGYPRRSTPEETRDIFGFAERVQKIITHSEAVEL